MLFDPYKALLEIQSRAAAIPAISAIPSPNEPDNEPRIAGIAGIATADPQISKTAEVIILDDFRPGKREHVP